MPDPGQMSRIIHMVRRTILVVDDEWRALNRLWCLFEVSVLSIGRCWEVVARLMDVLDMVNQQSLTCGQSLQSL